MAIVKRLDHITLFCAHEKDRQKMLSFLCAVLEFPQINPSTVWLGNVAVELMVLGLSRPPAFKGLCFEPYSFQEAIRSMKKTEFPYFQPFEDAIFFCPQPSFILSIMRHFSAKSDFYYHHLKRESIMMMVTEGTPRMAFWDSRAGVMDVGEVIVSSRTPDNFARFMIRVTDGHDSLFEDAWKLADSPTISLLPTGVTGITGLKIRVSSLHKCRDRLIEAHLLAEDHPDHLVSIPMGLRFTFSE